MFCGRGGEFVSFELLRHGWARVLVAAGIRTYKLHSSRHTAGLIVLAATGDIRAVSRVAATNVRHSAKPEKPWAGWFTAGEEPEFQVMASCDFPRLFPDRIVL